MGKLHRFCALGKSSKKFSGVAIFDSSEIDTTPTGIFEVKKDKKKIKRALQPLPTVDCDSEDERTEDLAQAKNAHVPKSNSDV